MALDNVPNAEATRSGNRHTQDHADLVLAALPASPTRTPVLGFAKLFASMHGSSVRAVYVTQPHNNTTVSDFILEEDVEFQLVEGDPMLEIVRAADSPRVGLVVVGSHNPLAGREPVSLTRELAVRLPKPLLVVPKDAAVPASLERVLFPLEGTTSTTASIGALLERLPFDPDTELIMMHSYTRRDVPRYADHEPYDTEYRIRDFRDKYVPVGVLGPIELRYGPPETVVPEVAAALGATLIVVSWSQVFAPGHAALVTTLIANPDRPTLLVPARNAPSSVPEKPRTDRIDIPVPPVDLHTADA